MQRKLAYASVASLILFGIVFFIAIALDSLALGYVASVLLFAGLLVGLFGLIFPILAFHIYSNVLSDTQKESIRINPLTRFMVYLGSNGKENFK
ncbi:hypothetical protein H7F16_19050 [Gemmobacter straminiformis]|uniref:Uncharacterized protein n=1 Tax=Paragemmobacter straminiformis TaxID=2045119 RepID=A0A842IDH5_9RHOB|nr:hypothetical protein [Gemmobacter straminiformis]